MNKGRRADRVPGTRAVIAAIVLAGLLAGSVLALRSVAAAPGPSEAAMPSSSSCTSVSTASSGPSATSRTTTS